MITLDFKNRNIKENIEKNIKLNIVVNNRQRIARCFIDDYIEIGFNNCLIKGIIKDIKDDLLVIESDAEDTIINFNSINYINISYTEDKIDDIEFDEDNWLDDYENRRDYPVEYDDFNDDDWLCYNDN